MAPNRISSITELTANSTPMADVSVRVPWNPSLQLVWSRKTLTYLTVQLWNVWFWASLKRCDIFWRADDSFWERLPALTIWVVWCWCFVKMLTLKPTQNPPFADRSVIVKDSWLSKWNSRSAQVNGGCQNRSGLISTWASSLIFTEDGLGLSVMSFVSFVSSTGCTGKPLFDSGQTEGGEFEELPLRATGFAWLRLLWRHRHTDKSSSHVKLTIWLTTIDDVQLAKRSNKRRALLNILL